MKRPISMVPPQYPEAEAFVAANPMSEWSKQHASKEASNRPSPPTWLIIMVRDALAQVDHADRLLALCHQYSAEAVCAAAEAFRSDVNYGLVAAAWLERP